MEYQKIINLLDNKSNYYSSKYKPKNLVKINDESRRMYNEDNQIRCKTSTLRLSICDYSGTYILVKGTNKYNTCNSCNA